MRVAIGFGAGVILGILLTFAVVQVSGGWYTYFILSPDDCAQQNGNAVTAEVVPNQPNPCHFRRPRWQLVR